MISVHNLQQAASGLLSEDRVDVIGKVTTRKSDIPFSFPGVRTDPARGRDALAIVLVLNGLDAVRSTMIDAATDTVKKPDIDDDTPFSEVQRVQSDYRTERARVRKGAQAEFDASVIGKTRLALLEKYRSCKRATFALPGTDTYATLSSVIGKVSGAKVASAYARSLQG